MEKKKNQSPPKKNSKENLNQNKQKRLKTEKLIFLSKEIKSMCVGIPNKLK